MANRPEPKFSWNNCAQNSKKTFMCPNFYTNRVLSIPNVIFLQICWVFWSYVYYIAKNYLPLLQQNADWLKKIGLVGMLLKVVTGWLEKHGKPSQLAVCPLINAIFQDDYPACFCEERCLECMGISSFYCLSIHLIFSESLPMWVYLIQLFNIKRKEI